MGGFTYTGHNPGHKNTVHMDGFIQTKILPDYQLTLVDIILRFCHNHTRKK